MERVRAAVAWGAIALAGLAAGGCGGPAYLVIASILGGSSGSHHGAAAPPSVAAPASIARADLANASGAPSATEIAIALRVSDPTFSPVALDARWRRASEPDAAFRAASAGPGSDDASALSSAPDPGLPHVFVWAAGKDLAAAGLVEDDVVLRLTPARAGVAGLPRDVALRAGDLGPVVTLAPSSGTFSRTALTSFTIADAASDPATVTLFANGAAVRNLLVAPGAPTTVLATPGGTGASVVWDTVAAFGPRNLTATITLVARDPFGVEGRASADVAIENDHPPSVEVVSALGFPNKPLRGRVPVTIAVNDPDALLDPAGSGRADILVDFSTDGGQTFQPASVLGLGRGAHDAGSVLRGVPTGVFPDVETGRVTVLWDAAADIRRTDVGGTPVTLRFTPKNTLEGLPAQVVGTVTDAATFDSFDVGFAEPLGLHVLVADFPPNFGSAGPVFYADMASGQFEDPLVLPRAVAADLRGTGRLDVAGLDGSPQVRILPGTGSSYNPGGLSVQVPRQYFGAEVDVPLAGLAPYALAAGDFDGDGIMDLAVACGGSPSSIVLLRGLGGGAFAPPVTIASDPGDRFGGIFSLDPSSPDVKFESALFAVDLDGDGILDLALFGAGRAGAGHVATLRGRGDGSFDFVDDVHFAGDVPDIALADFTGDGVLDLAVIDQVAATFQVGRGRGDGRFDLLPPQQAGQPRGPLLTSIAAIEDPDDAKTGLCILQGQVAEVLSFQGRGDGVFDSVGAARLPPSGNGQPFGITPIPRLAGLVWANGQIVSIGRAPAFDQVATIDLGANLPASDLIALDTRGSGVEDLVTSAGAAVSLSHADGSFDLIQPDASLLSFGSFLAAGRFTLGAFPDVAVGGNEEVAILRGEGGGAFALLATIPDAQAFETPGPYAVADFNGDGIPDLAIVESGILAIYAGRGDGHFDPVATLPLSGITAIRAADMNGDGIPDLVVGGSSVVLIGRGNGDFNTLQGPAIPGGFVIADFDGDGIPDIIAPQGTSINLFRGLGDGSFALVASLFASGAAGSAGNGNFTFFASGDLAGDGLPSFIFAGNLFPDELQTARGRFPRTGATGRGERGGGARTEANLSKQFAAGPFSPPIVTATLLDATLDGIPDVAAIDDFGLQVAILSGAGLRPSRPLDLRGAAPPAGFEARDLRVTTAPALDPALGEPGLVATPTAGMRLAPASLATTVSPDRASFAEDFTLTLPLFAELTGEELASPAIHVYRYERDVQGTEFLPYRAPLVGRIVEVASTAPARPAGIALATVDAGAGTIAFPVRRLGTFQIFIEKPVGTLTLFRETFDDASVAPGAVSAPFGDLLFPTTLFTTNGESFVDLGFAPGWSLTGMWSIGPPPTATAAPAGPDAPASFPNALGTARHAAGYRASADDAATSPPIQVPSPLPNGAKIVLRYRERVRLADAGAAAAVEVVFADGSSAPVPGAGHGGPFASGGNAFVDAGPFDLTALVGGKGSFQLRFHLTTGNGAAAGRGFYVDDIDVEIEP
jgi:hypothetical protein